MPPLFFAVAAGSSDSSGSGPDRLALLPGSQGWQSARCCQYPQELLLELERGAEISEIEVAARGELAPRAVEVHLSVGAISAAGAAAFEHACTVYFDHEEVPRRVSTARRARQKLFALCSGQVRLVIHEPASACAGNAFRQVALASVELWGREDVCASTAKLRVSPKRSHGASSDIANLSLGGLVSRAGYLGEAAHVLTELGIPLSVVPVDEDSHWYSEADVHTRQLLLELKTLHARHLEASRLGEAQQVSEHMRHLATLGAELRRLQADRDRCVGARSLEDAQQFLGPIWQLEENRLRIAALYDTDFWAEQMEVAPLSDTRVLEIPPADSALGAGPTAP